jgi:hypothetical protein
MGATDVVLWARSPGTQPSRAGRAEGVDPLADRLVGRFESALGEQFFDVSVAEREEQVEPHGALDNVSRETIAGVAEKFEKPGLLMQHADSGRGLLDQELRLAGSVFPFLFITIACGAVSGWHALKICYCGIASGVVDRGFATLLPCDQCGPPLDF